MTALMSPVLCSWVQTLWPCAAYASESDSTLLELQCTLSGVCV